MSGDDERWAAVAAGLSQACVDSLRARLAKPGLMDLTAAELASTAGCEPAEAEDVLERSVTTGLLTRRVETTCPCCSEALSPEDLAAQTGVCPYCNRAFVDCGSGPEETVHFSREAEAGRSVPWVLVLHGMNTRGAWQGELSWLIATTYGRSVPVFIYKYGRIRTGVLLGWRRRSLTRKLAQRIQDLAGQREHDRLGPRPDVIAHSFGTWMLGHALASTDSNLADLAVGRVVLLGSILRPSFSWTDVVARGRAEAILNHYGTADIWAGLGGYVIYDAGPSGRRGFDSVDADERQTLIDRDEPGFGHSSFFQPAQMRKVYLDTWKRFLTEPLTSLPALERGSRAAPWRPPPRVLRLAAGVMAFALVAAVVALVATALVLGLIRLLSLAIR